MKSTYLEARGLGLCTPGGRCLIRALEMRLEQERVALVGRNGVGKTSLIEVLAGERSPSQGRVICCGSRHLVPQQLDSSGMRKSPGEVRRALLERARILEPDFLFLDEPSRDLDAAGSAWLADWLASFRNGLVVVSHDRRILRTFSHFFVIAERGCRLFCGSFSALLQELEREQAEANRKYVSQLNRLMDQEQHNAAIRNRRARKKAGGRVRELGRCPSRIRLNNKRSYAQVYQGKREGVREQRIAAAREWARRMRRALSVDLPLELRAPVLPSAAATPLIQLERVGARTPSRILFSDVSLSLERDRLGVTGPNGSGKTTLLELMAGRLAPRQGAARVLSERIGYVAQHAGNWHSDKNLLQCLLTGSSAANSAEVAQQIMAHRFPLSLAERPMKSLSPGERTRAALICLFSRTPPLELLLLDEPTDELDFVGTAALERVLSAWPGGLVVVSHDQEFLDRIGVTRRLELGCSKSAETPDEATEGTPQHPLR